jgi:hypothetical protein
MLIFAIRLRKLLCCLSDAKWGQNPFAVGYDFFDHATPTMVEKEKSRAIL